jgi:peptide/nickel transport system permease protein
MLQYALRRLLIAMPTLLLITMVVFAIVKLAPGNPFSISQASSERAVARMDRSDYEALLARYGLDKPWYVQYWRWLKGAATGSFGDSFSERRPVAEVFFGKSGAAQSPENPSLPLPSLLIRRFLDSKVGATLFLNMISLLLIAGCAVPLGLYAAVHKGGVVDKVSSTLFYGLYALPNFWGAVLLILLFGVTLKSLPFYGMHSDGSDSMGAASYLLDAILHAVLPAICLAYGSLAFMARFSRGVLLDVLHQDYIRTARAKGLPERLVILRHGLRNALIPFITLFGLLLPELVAGSVIIETIFAWPGLGQMYVKAIYTRDYPLILAESLLGAMLVLAGTLLADLGYAAADPRIRRA